MPNLNKIMVMGHLGGDPELREGGSPICKFSLATTEKWTKDGEKQEKTTWHNVIAFGKQAEILAKYVHKGSPIYVEGRQEHDSYEKDGETKYWSQIVVHNFQFLSNKSDDNTAKDGGGDSKDLPF